MRLLELSCAVGLETDQRDLDVSARRGSQVISDEVRSPREIWRRVTPPDPNGAREISILRPSSAPTTGHSRRPMHFAPRVEFYRDVFAILPFPLRVTEKSAAEMELSFARYTWCWITNAFARDLEPWERLLPYQHQRDAHLHPFSRSFFKR